MNKSKGTIRQMKDRLIIFRMMNKQSCTLVLLLIAQQLQDLNMTSENI